jgi:hypothetical protein
MNKKKILTIGPVSIDPKEVSSIANTLSFLDKDYDIDYIDSLLIMENLSNAAYYALWQQKLATYVNDYDAFFGFSFGGVIIQQCFSLFENQHKPIILFSTPTFADAELNHKLGQVIHLCEQEQLEAALNALYEPVFAPYEMPKITCDKVDRDQAYKRLIFGLSRVLQTDSSNVLKNNRVPHLHLIGEYSHLVNRHNVIAPSNGRLIIVPKASMRVLQDNNPYCQKIILEALSHESS